MGVLEMMIFVGVENIVVELVSGIITGVVLILVLVSCVDTTVVTLVIGIVLVDTKVVVEVRVMGMVDLVDPTDTIVEVTGHVVVMMVMIF